MSLFSTGSTRISSASHTRPDQRGRAIAVLAVVLAVLVACSTSALTPVQQAQVDAFNALKTIRVTVVAAVGVFNVGYQSGQFNEGQRTQMGEIGRAHV